MTAGGDGVDGHYLLLGHGHRVVLRLLQDLHHPAASLQLDLAGGVQFGPELGKGLQLAELRQVEAQRPRHSLHGPHLGGAATRETEMPALMAGRTPE